jgi:hypothetical protein
MTITPTPSAQSGSMWRDLLSSPLTAAAVVVAMSGVVAIFAPNLVTGSEHEQLPLAALTIWPWTAAAVGYVLMAGQRRNSRDRVLGVTVVWVAVAVLSVAVPAMVTGTDPTRIPIAALIVPPFGAVATGFLAIAHARGAARRASEG